MYLNLLHVGKHFNPLRRPPERIYSQILNLTRYENKSSVICRLAHKKVNRSNSKDLDSLFDQLRTLKVTKALKFRQKQASVLNKRNIEIKTKVKIIDQENNKYDVIRPETNGDEESLKERIFESKNETSEETDQDGFPPLILSRSVTPKLEEKILDGIPNKRYILKEALLEIEKLEKNREFKFILPKSMTVDEWRTLISLHDLRSRTTYVHSLVLRTPSLEEIQKLDENYLNPLQLDPKLLKEVQDEDGQRKIKIFLMEHEMLRQEGEMVPYVFSEKDVFVIADLKSSTARSKLMMTMLAREIRAIFNEMKKRQMEVKNPKLMEKQRSLKNEIHEESSHNTILLNYNKQTINMGQDWSAVREFHEWGIPLVIDLSHTSKCEHDRLTQNTMVSEILNSISINREAKTPFQLHITNIQPEITPKLAEELSKNADVRPYNITSESHLDMFPHDRLVYLSPDSRMSLEKFNSDDIYVIGGIVDKPVKDKQRVPLTLSAAKKYNIRHARFPTRHVFGVQPALNINTCVAILNDMKETKDWFYSLRWLPSGALLKQLRNSNLPEHELLFRAHTQLNPSNPDMDLTVRLLNPTKYRYYFKKIMECRSKQEMETLIGEIEM